MNSCEEFLRVEGWESGFESVNLFLRHYRRKVRSEHTKSNALYALKGLSNFVGLGPEELVKLTHDEASSRVQDFVDYLASKDYSIRYVNVNLAFLKTFFRVNGFKGNKALEVERHYQPLRYRKREEYIPTSEEIYKMAYASGSTRNKALVLALYTSGLRNSTLRALLYRDVKDELENGLEILNVPVYPEMKKIVEDIGILASRDPVAIDKAAIDLVEAKAGMKLSQLIDNKELNPDHQIRHAERIGLGTSDYELVEVE